MSERALDLQLFVKAKLSTDRQSIVLDTTPREHPLLFADGYLSQPLSEGSYGVVKVYMMPIAVKPPKTRGPEGTIQEAGTRVLGRNRNLVPVLSLTSLEGASRPKSVVMPVMEGG